MSSQYGPHPPSFSGRMSADSSLDEGASRHLQRLVAWWGLLADFAFSDLLLFVPGRSGDFFVAGHVRPTTSGTLYEFDIVGRLLSEAERPLVARSHARGETVEGEVTLPDGDIRARVECVPVRHEGEVIAILTKESTPGPQRGSQLETVYMTVWRRFGQMIHDGLFPFAIDETDTEDVPRVGDGVIVLDADMCIAYASPNATSTLHRLGVSRVDVGVRLVEIGLEQSVVRRAFGERTSVNEEVERGDDSIADILAVPLLDGDRATGAVVIVRDVSELRRRDRLLISKDATIREIHHRVKNNLQTISSLLRLQSRRIESPEARGVIEESVRRIASIALVHETLAHGSGKDVALHRVMSDLVRMFGDAVRTPERPIVIRVEGDPGMVSAEVATPLAVVLNELLQNTVDHCGGQADLTVDVTLLRSDEHLEMNVIDNGPGLPEDFDVASASGLGLSIVRALIGSDLDGTITMERRPQPERGSTVTVRIPAAAVGGDGSA